MSAEAGAPDGERGAGEEGGGAGEEGGAAREKPVAADGERAPTATRPGSTTGAGENGDRPPRVAPGIELVGEYEDSGFKIPPYLIRREGGQTIQVSQLLFLIAEAADGQRGVDEIAEQVTDRFGRRVSPDNVRQLVGKRLQPLGVLVGPDGRTAAQPQARRQLLQLNLRSAFVPRAVVTAITTVFRPLFLPPVVVGVLVALGAFDVWLFGMHGVAQSVRQLLDRPLLMVAVLGLVILSAAFHECGHATACRYSGATPGEMGAGLYMVWPAFYTDVTDAYRCSKGGRLRTDLGGVYFNAIFILALGGVFYATGFEVLLAVIALLHVEMLHQFLPFLRLDGYYLVSDLVGVPDLFMRIKPTLLSLVPWRPTTKEVDELKPWVRAAVTAWVILTIPVLVYVYVMMIVNAPRIFATAWGSGSAQGRHAATAFSGGSIGTGLLDLVQLIALLLPAVGVAYVLGRTGWRLGGGAWRRTDGHPVARSALLAAAGATAALAVVSLVPREHYRPIGPQDRGTLQGGARALSPVLTGQPLQVGTEPTPAASPAPEASPSPSPGASPSPSPDTSPSPESSPSPGGSPSPTSSQTRSSPQPAGGGNAPAFTPVPRATPTP